MSEGRCALARSPTASRDMTSETATIPWSGNAARLRGVRDKSIMIEDDRIVHSFTPWGPVNERWPEGLVSYQATVVFISPPDLNSEHFTSCRFATTPQYLNA